MALNETNPAFAVPAAEVELTSLASQVPVFFEGQRLPASYANFYIANNVVLLPVFGHANDARAAETLQGVFPERRVIPINCEPLVWGMAPSTASRNSSHVL